MEYGGGVRVLIDHERVKTIKIHCRCGQAIVEKIPAQFFEAGIIPIVACPKCHTDYAMHEDKIIRLDRTGNPEKVIARKKGMTQERAQDEIEKIIEELRDKGVTIVDSSGSGKAN